MTRIEREIEICYRKRDLIQRRIWDEEWERAGRERLTNGLRALVAYTKAQALIANEQRAPESTNVFVSVPAPEWLNEYWRKHDQREEHEPWSRSN